MRAALLAASLIFVAALAGCADKGKDSDFHVTCPGGKELHSEDFTNVTTTADLLKKCPGATTTRTTTSTPSTPNVFPVAKLAVTDAGGNATAVSFLGINLTFDASGSSDSDGNITGAAVSVADANQTRTASLFDPVAKKFKSAVFAFDRPGPVNVTLAIVDDRAGFTTNTTVLYINEVVTKGSTPIQVPAALLAGESPLHHPCLGAGAELGNQGPIVHTQYFNMESIPLQPGATFVEVVSEQAVVMTICDPTGVAVSPELQADKVTSNKPLPLPADGTENYHVAFYASEPGATTAVTMTIHYEPVAAATA